MYFTRSKLLEFKAAGVLPITVYNGQPYVLLGAESCRTGPEGRVWKLMWRDFGGQREAIDADSADTAAREFAEETLGVFGGCDVNPGAVLRSARQMAAQLQSATSTFRVVHQLKKGEYHMFISSTPFIEPVMFHLALQQNLQSRAIAGAEKTDFTWVRLPELLEAVARCSRQYHFSSRQRLSARTQQQQRAGGHRLQLHPCFASSLRLARDAGLEAFVAALIIADAPPPPTPPPQPVVKPPPAPKRPPAAIDPSTSRPHSSHTPPAGSCGCAPPAAAAGSQQGATVQVEAGPPVPSTTAPAAGSGHEPGATEWPSDKGAVLGHPAGRRRQGGAPAAVQRGLTPDHMMYWLMQAGVASQLALPDGACASGQAGAADGGAADGGVAGPAVHAGRSAAAAGVSGAVPAEGLGGGCGMEAAGRGGCVAAGGDGAAGAGVAEWAQAGSLPRRRRKRRRRSSVADAAAAASMPPAGGAAGPPGQSGGES